jgi:hypothetical protein
MTFFPEDDFLSGWYFPEACILITFYLVLFETFRLFYMTKPKRTNTENYLREFKAAWISLNKVREIKSREFKAERKWVRREF